MFATHARPQNPLQDPLQDPLPDPADLTWTKLHNLVRNTAKDLAPFARLAGKERKRADSVEAALALPEELAGTGAIVLPALAAAAVTASGHLGHTTIASLERLCDALGLDRRALYGPLHEAATALPAAQGPVLVEQPARRSTGRRIPPPPATRPATGIDMAKVAAILGQTREVASVLAPIYQDEEAAPPPPPQPAACAFPGLQPGFAQLLQALATQPHWARPDFQAQARSHGLPPDGAIETLNDWAYDALGDELIEDGEVVAVNLDLLRAVAT